MNSIAAALAAAQAKLPPGEARLLLGHVLGQSLTYLIAHNDEALDEKALLAFAALVARRSGGEPVAYLLGQREFFGREFAVSEAVLIPRPETELLVEIALAKLGAGETTEETPAQQEGAGQNPARFAADALKGGRAKTALLAVADGATAAKPVRLLDLGTGSGCIAVTLALECPRTQVTAIDASTAALSVAKTNAERHGAALRLLRSDWFSELKGERFDLIVANPPYIAAGDPHLAAGDLRHEPPAALASGGDGLDALRQIIDAAPAHLESGGQLWLEHGYDQAAAVRDLLLAAGFNDIGQYRDLAGIVRVSGGRAT